MTADTIFTNMYLVEREPEPSTSVESTITEKHDTHIMDTNMHMELINKNKMFGGRS